MMQELDRLRGIAEDLGLTANINHTGPSVEVEFQSIEDRELFYRFAWDSNLHTHIVRFTDPDFIPIWTEEFERVMVAVLADAHELHVAEDRVCFSTHDADTHALFVMLERQGMFNGPVGGGEHWQPAPREDVRDSFRELCSLETEPPSGGSAVMAPQRSTEDLRHLEDLMLRVRDRAARNGRGQSREPS